jgi:hypothetical protein
MGAIFEAVEVPSGRHVALKLIHAKHASAKTAVERFRREGLSRNWPLRLVTCLFTLAA